MSNTIHSPHENKLLKMSVLLGDIIIINLLYWLFCCVLKYDTNIDAMRQTMVVGSIVYLACTMENGVVLHHRKVSNHQIIMRVMQNFFVGAIGCVIMFAIGDFQHMSLFRMIEFWLTAFVGVSIFRIITRHVVAAWRRMPKHAHNVVFVGSNSNARNMFRQMTIPNDLGFNVLGYFDHQPNEKFSELCTYLGTPQDMPEVLKEHSNVHELYCCLPSRFSEEILEVIRYCEHHFIHFYSMPNVNNYLHHRMHLKVLGDVPYLSLYNEPLSLIENRLIKRTFDFVVSLTFLCTLFPIILAVVAIVTKITMPGPLFFRQKRTGLNGKEFYCLKFRSMKVNLNSATL